MGIPSRVYGRLHWDKQFHGISLFVKAEGGTVTVRGTLPDDEAKAKAIELIKDTVGVTRVIDQLSVLSSSEGVSSPAVKRLNKADNAQTRRAITDCVRGLQFRISPARTRMSSSGCLDLSVFRGQ